MRSAHRSGLFAGAFLLALVLLVWLVLRPDTPPAASSDREPREVDTPPQPPAEPSASARSPQDRLPSPELEEEFEALVAAASQLAAMPDEYHEGVKCELAEPIEPYQGVFVMMWGDMIYGSYPAFTQGTTVSLDVARPSGQGYLHVPGRQPVWVEFRNHFRWPEGSGEALQRLHEQGMRIPEGEAACSPEPIQLVEGEANVRGHVRNAEGQPEGRIWVAGCGGHTLTEEDGSYELSVLPDPCAVRAYRMDGLFTARGSEEPVAPVPGEDRVVDLAVPDWPTAGMGIAFRQGDGGMEVLRVIEGGDAFDQGLQSGDLIVGIEGQPTADMPLESFVDLALGQEGSEVALGIAEGDAVREVTITRRTLE